MPADCSDLRRLTRRSGGFTLIETVVVVILIALLMSLLIGGIAFAIKSARRSGEKQLLVTLGLATTQFKDQFGSLPPLVNDCDPLDNMNRLNVRTADFMRNTTEPGEPRYSYFSTYVMLAGGRGKEIDGIDGPGMTAWAPSNGAAGQFLLKGPKTDSLLDMGRLGERLVPATAPLFPGSCEWVDQLTIGDRWKQPVRYYRWEPTFSANGTITTTQVSQFLPPQVSALLTRAEWSDQATLFRDSRFAFQSAGPDSIFDNEDDLWEFGR